MNDDPRDPTNYIGIVECHLCGCEHSNEEYHVCKEITDED